MPDDTPPPDDKPRPWEKQPRSRDRDRGDRDPDRDERRGRRQDEDDEEWEEEDRPRRRRRRDEDEEDEYDPALRMVVPINTSALAIIAGYFGLVSVLCIPAPFALVLGILALNHLNKNPKLDGKGRAIFAIVMGTIFSMALGISLVITLIR